MNGEYDDDASGQNFEQSSKKCDLIFVNKSKIICWRQSFLTKGTYTLRWIFSTGFVGALYVLQSVHVNITQND